MRKAVVTGGTGFIGAYLVKRLLEDGYSVEVIDNCVRGDIGRLGALKNEVSFHEIDIRDQDAVLPALRNADVVFHLAAVNGTQNFYSQPDLVLDVGLKGALSVVEGCIKCDVPDLVVASSAEVYQTAAVVPTDETVPLNLPNSHNPRFSYGGSKILSELIAFNYGKDHFRKVQVFRPHNVYGPDMGWMHVIPQFICKALKSTDSECFEMQGSGDETRAFCYVDDVVEGILKMYSKGESREVYHIGNDDEVSINELADKIFRLLKIQPKVINVSSQAGSTARRCPDIKKMRALGFHPDISLDEGLERTTDWYRDNPEQLYGDLS